MDDARVIKVITDLLQVVAQGRYDLRGEDAVKLATVMQAGVDLVKELQQQDEKKPA